MLSSFRDEQLLRERMRKVGSSSKYDYLRDKDMILLHGAVPELLSVKVMSNFHIDVPKSLTTIGSCYRNFPSV